MTALIDLIEDTKLENEKEEYLLLLKESNDKMSKTIHFLN